MCRVIEVRMDRIKITEKMIRAGDLLGELWEPAGIEPTPFFNLDRGGALLTLVDGLRRVRPWIQILTITR